MKQLSILFLAIISLSSTIQAQNLSYGIQGGLTVGAVLGPRGENDTGQPLWSPHLGMYIQYQIHPKWAIQGEVTYLANGVSYQAFIPESDTLYAIEVPEIDTIFYTPTSYTANVEGAFQLHYIDLPIRLIWQVSEKIGLNVGTRLAFLLNGKHSGEAVVTIGNNYAVNKEPFDESHALRSVDWGVTGGGHWKVTERLRLGVTANYGFIPIQKQTDFIQDDFRNIYINSSLSYRLGRF